ncbi:type II toxin-antitoxin system PemK/MazF family toxin [Escherichia coli]|nr:type II toxin-antitoxin system PemK/MazF family toxin [Escherichia coli]
MIWQPEFTDKTLSRKIGAVHRCQSSKAIVEQIMAADKSCLKTHIGSLSKADMLSVEDAIKIHLGLLR